LFRQDNLNNSFILLKKILKISLLIIVCFGALHFVAPALSQGVPTGELLTPEDITGIYGEAWAGIPKGRSLIELVLDITDYVLGFVGIIALVAFIYGGYLMVANFGNDDMFEKGKKTITYSAIGIIVILLSFVGVNTILRAGGGVEGRQEGVGEAVVSTEDIITQLRNDAENFLSKLNVMGDMCPGTPRGQQVGEKGCAIGEYPGDSDGDGVVNVLDLDDDNDGIPDADDSDNDGDGVRDEEDFCPNTLKIELSGLDSDEDNYVGSDGCADYEILQSGDSDSDGVMNAEDLDDDDDGLCDGRYTAATLPSGATCQLGDRDDDGDGVENFFQGTESDDPSLVYFAQLYDKFRRDIYTTCNRLPGTTKVKFVCEDAKNALRKFEEGPASKENLSDLLDRVNDLAILVSQTPAVIANIKASRVSGSAPLTVAFDASETIDPFGYTIPGENYYWYFDDVDDRSDASGVFVTGEFEEGVYMVRLEVKTGVLIKDIDSGASSEDGEQKAAMDGLAVIKITATPPTADIHLAIDGIGPPIDATNKTFIKTVLRDPDDGITLTFNPQGTTFAEGATLTNAKWDYGDDTNPDVVENLNPITHQYKNKGTYDFSLTLTDNRGLVNVKSLAIIIQDISATFDISPQNKEGDTTTQFTFDASDSSTAQGNIRSYIWKIYEVNVGAKGAQVGELTGEVVNHVFPLVGRYIVELTVIGDAGQADNTSEFVEIQSRSPKARMRWQVKDRLQPARVLFDASSSFDPDPNTDLSFKWEIDGLVVKLKDFGLQDETDLPMIGFYEFDKVGPHKVELVVSDRPDGAGLQDRITEIVTIDSTLGVDFIASGYAATIGDIITFTAESPNAIDYYWDFGSGVKEFSSTPSISHKYNKTGFYVVKLTVTDREGNENTTTKKIRIGDKNAPVAMVKLSIKGKEVEPEEDICGRGNGVIVDRLTTINLDGSESINTDGTTRGLQYAWDLEEGEISTKRTTIHRYDELTKGTACREISLTVKDRITGATDSAPTLYAKVENIKPDLNALDVIKPANLVTPVAVPVLAIAPQDPDGRIMEYRWWYYDDDFPKKQFGLHTTNEPRTNFVIGPNGPEGTENKYYFVVEILDNDGGKITNEEILGKSAVLQITNGPNIAPIAEFTVDKIRAKVGERITFTSTTKDPLGKYIPTTAYQWDLDGDGRYDNGVKGKVVRHAYEKANTYMPRLKVTQNGIATTYEMKIIVEPITEDPEAAFLFLKSGTKITFINNSSVDSRLEVRDLLYKWDFDLSIDSDGNGIKDDDVDSALVNPTKVYDGDKDVQVKLSIGDIATKTDSVIRTVEFIEKPDIGPLGGTTALRLRADLKTDPEADPIDKKVYLKAPAGEVTFKMRGSVGRIMRYKFDANIYEDSDDDGVEDNDLDNKEHPSFLDGTPFDYDYSLSDGQIRAKLTIIDDKRKEVSTYVDIVFNTEGKGPLEASLDPNKLISITDKIPVTIFKANKEFIMPGDEVEFDASSSSFPEGVIESYYWDFESDGRVDEITTKPIVTLVFEEEGEYEVTLETVSSDELRGRYSTTIFVKDIYQAPLADFDYEADGRTVRFTNKSSLDKSFTENDVIYEWKFIKVFEEDFGEEMEIEEISEEVVLADKMDEEKVIATRLIQVPVEGDYLGVITQNAELRGKEVRVYFDQGAEVNWITTGEPFNKSLSAPREIGTPKGTIEEGKNILYVVLVGVPQALDLSEPAEISFDLANYEGLVNPQIYYLDVKTKEWVLIGGERVGDKLIISTSHLSIFALVDNKEGGRRSVTAEEEFEAELLQRQKSTSENPVKIFPTYGTYKVILTVEDKTGKKDTKIDLVTLEIPPEGEEVILLPEEIEEGLVEEVLVEEEGLV